MPSNHHLSIPELFKLCQGDWQQLNCIAASLLRKYNAQNYPEIQSGCYHLDHTLEIGESFVSKVKDLSDSLGYGPEAFCRLHTQEDFKASKANEYFLVFGHQKRLIEQQAFGCRWHEAMYDFHVVIGVRDAAGTVQWYHKFGVSMEQPREVTTEDWDEIQSTYTSNPPALFEFWDHHKLERNP